MIRCDAYIDFCQIDADEAFHYNTLTKFAANLIGPWLTEAVVIATQAAFATILGLFLQG